MIRCCSFASGACNSYTCLDKKPEEMKDRVACTWCCPVNKGCSDNTKADHQDTYFDCVEDEPECLGESDCGCATCMPTPNKDEVPF